MADETLAALRSLMASHSPPLDALVVPSEDYHQSEYVSARDKRREFVSGFSGSAGLALILANEALLWTDGRYFLQAEKQLSNKWKLMRMGEDPVVDIWMADNLPSDAAIGVDPWCISVDTAQKWERAFAKKQQKLIKTTTNLVDEVWSNRPPPEAKPVALHPLEFSGRSVAWLFNVRGSDVSYNPVIHAYAIVTSSAAFFYVDKRKVSSEASSYMEKNGIEVRNYGDVIADAALLASEKLISTSSVKEIGIEGNKNDLVWVDPGSCCFALYTKLNADKVFLQSSPLALAKALKNPIEIEGLKNAHIRDGAAVVQYLVWLDKQMQEIYGASGYFLESEANKKDQQITAKLTEVSVSDKLEEFRASKEHFRGLSFPTISSVGPNGAVIHYSPEAETCAELDPNRMYLFDSGAQYLDGTTDITRTVHFGKPTSHEKACYTAVLKGHIGLGNARFPSGTTGHILDVLARLHLWKDGLDYRHGTGHGIGSFLNVHEGPHQISFRPAARNVPLQSSMTVTDEPGYYEDGNFGIRLENVLVVKEADTKFNFGDKGYLSFEHITWLMLLGLGYECPTRVHIKKSGFSYFKNKGYVGSDNLNNQPTAAGDDAQAAAEAPYQMKLMDVSLLVPEEIEWLNKYHSRCREILAPHLNTSEKDWLKNATEPIAA
ncbi:probable xaa-pro aminopeptidase p [Phtheirospermum japonicum]|uniref:Probable xaa-pro aminopeptidase p n=1 Tax=Phtheirospermum japonicum TaxID=374723 RepID=A0A830BK83_9LAMI|nr:probable xaa-pro aminopeptidase p [Phtheirospermum japonicum]